MLKYFVSFVIIYEINRQYYTIDTFKIFLLFKHSLEEMETLPLPL